MKLNANILFSRLKDRYSIELTGTPRKDLHLGPPVLCSGPRKEFLPDIPYIAAAKDLVAHPLLSPDTVLICTGDPPALAYYRDRCTVLCIKGDPDIHEVFEHVQNEFNRYNEWNDKLFELFQSEHEIAAYLEESLALFNRPMVVLNANFQTIAARMPEGARVTDTWEEDLEGISENSMARFLEVEDLSTEVHEPIFLQIKGHRSLCVNLYDRTSRYIGCVWVDCTERNVEPGMDALLDHLGRILEKIIERVPALMASTHGSVRQILGQMLDGESISPNQQWLLSSYGLDTPYVCVSLHLLTSQAQMPLEYISNVLEATFPNSIAFPRENHVVAFLNLTELKKRNIHYQKELSETLIPILYSLKLHCGISNESRGLTDPATHYLQAEIADENGVIAQPQLTCHYFSSYTLMEMVSNSLGGLPIETYYPEGIWKVLEHDKNSGISYLETLRVFLDENMNYSSASRLLYVHRSTLIDRIGRISKEMGFDLNDPNERLMLHLLLKAMELEEMVRNRN